jgi:hypothetical protein
LGLEFPTCCELQKCNNITATCLQATQLKNGLSCQQTCLSNSNSSCHPPKALPKDYSCFLSFFNDTKFNPLSIICNQTYQSNSLPAPEFNILYRQCKHECSGFALSDIPSQWSFALLQYIFPSVVFSMTIPRRQKWEVPSLIIKFPFDFFSLKSSRLSFSPSYFRYF